MKKIQYIFLLPALLLFGCNDAFLERYPSTEITPNAFFKTVKDLEVYSNKFYDNLYPVFMDGVTDNAAIYSDNHETLNLLKGNVSPANTSGWDWTALRQYNTLIENVHSVQGDPERIHHYLGVARLFRANWYYEMVKRYHRVPWYSRTLTDTDTDLLYKVQDSRELVVDSIIADLKYAVKYISEDMGETKTLVNKWYAYGCMARIALHEGSFRKYHDELALQGTAEPFFQMASDAAGEIMKANLFQIDKTGGFNKAYLNLFVNYSLDKSPEMLLIKDYDQELKTYHAAGIASFTHITNLSRSLMESYEWYDGTTAKPFTAVSGYATKKFKEVFENRDPRFAQTFMPPGYTRPGESSAFVPNMNLGGYPQVKFASPTVDQLTWGSSYTDLPLMRYAEILLIKAEAEAEMGNMSQTLMDNTVNEIRSRVGMPSIQIGQIADDINLKKQYPGITDKALLQIRRERRIELAGEGFRLDDIKRWAVGELLTGSQQGIYIDKLGLQDTNGDGTPDIAIFENPAANNLTEAEKGKYAVYYLKTSSGVKEQFSLTNGFSGHFVANGDLSNRTFVSPKYYYFPVPKQQRTINPNLRETIFWE